MFKECDGLALASHAFQCQTFDIWLAIAICRLAIFDGSFELVDRVKIEDVGYGRVIGGVVIHFKPSALIMWSTENGKVSVTQFKKRESTGIDQMQGLSILANSGKPKLTVGTFVILQVFDSHVSWIQVDVQLIVYSLARISDTHAKVRAIVIKFVFTIF